MASCLYDGSAVDSNVMPPPEVLMKVFKELNFTQLRKMTKVCQLWSVLADDPLLYKEVILTCEDKISSEEVKSALEGKTHLQRLDLHSRLDCREILKCAARNAANLKHLSITMCYTIPDMVDTLVEFCPRIECLNLSHNTFYNWSNSHALRFCELKQLKVLDLSFNYGFPLPELLGILRECKQLSEFSLHLYGLEPLPELGDLIVIVANNIGPLRKFRFDEVSMSQVVFRELHPLFQELEIMGIENASSMKDEQLMSLSLQKLVWLRLQCLSTSHIALDTMLGQCNLTNLRYLDLSQSTSVENNTLNQIAEKCCSLVCLKLEGCLNVTDDGLAQLMEGCRLQFFAF